MRFFSALCFRRRRHIFLSAARPQIERIKRRRIRDASPLPSATRMRAWRAMAIIRPLASIEVRHMCIDYAVRAPERPSLNAHPSR